METWLGGVRKEVISMPVPKDLVRIEIDPERRFADVDPLNQTWPRR